MKSKKVNNQLIILFGDILYCGVAQLLSLNPEIKIDSNYFYVWIKKNMGTGELPFKIKRDLKMKDGTKSEVTIFDLKNTINKKHIQ